jgi:predicted transposase YdaD
MNDMSIQQTTQIPEVKETIVRLRQLSADEKIQQEAYYREKRLHDEATALASAKREGIAEGRAEGKAEQRAEKIFQMRKLGFTEEQIKAIWDE